MGGYIVLLFVVLRVVQAITRKSPPPSASSSTVPGRVYLLIWLGGWLLGGPFLVASNDLGWPFTAFLSVLLAGIFFPWLLARTFAIPLGWVRTSYVLGWLARFVWRADPQGGAVAAAALARRRRRRVSPRTERWLRQRLDGLGMWRGAATLAAALASETDGDRDLARTQMWAVEDFDPRVCPALARRLAAQWLLLEAAARGDWPEVCRRVEDRSLRRDRTAWLLGAVARRLLREDGAPGDFRLRILWLLAPGRRRTDGLLARALAVPRAAAPEEDEAAAGLEGALRLYVEVLTRPSVRCREGVLRRLGQAWQEVLDGTELRDGLAGRFQALGGPADPASAASAFEESLETALAELVAEAPASALSGGEVSALVSVASWNLIESRETELAIVVESLAERVRSRRGQAPATEHAAWCNVRRLYERTAAVAGIESRRVAFDTAAADLLRHSAWLFNQHGQRPLANAIFRWLLGEALETGHVQYVEVLEKNTKVRL